jgi:hypothetical protein
MLVIPSEHLKQKQNKGCVTLWPCHLHLKVSYGERRIMETPNIFTMPKYSIQKNPLKENQNPSRYCNSMSNTLKFQHKPKYHLSKILI